MKLTEKQLEALKELNSISYIEGWPILPDKRIIQSLLKKGLVQIRPSVEGLKLLGERVPLFRMLSK